MKHTIRSRIINEYGLPVVKIEQLNGELGSGITDKNGKEIFEGDKVKDNVGNEFEVAFIPTAVTYCDELSRDLKYWADELEIVGHVDD